MSFPARFLNVPVPGGRMRKHSVYVEVLHSLRLYSYEQKRYAVEFAWALGRGRFVLCEPPAYQEQDA